MNMREKIARAILKSNGDFGEALGFTWQDYLPDADAALEAMREPTDGMIEAGQWPVEAADTGRGYLTFS